MSKRKYDHSFVVDRETWIRGGVGESLLRREDGHQCCLGFFLRSCGLLKKDILAAYSPKDLLESSTKKTDFLFNENYDNSPQTYSLMEANDSKYSDAKIEKKLKKLFAENKVRITFKGKRRPTNNEMSK